jgi:hypothetical protein
MKPKILHFSPVRKSNEIVALHLKSLQDLKQENFELTYSFFDDNIDAKSSEHINDFVSDSKSILFDKIDLIEKNTSQGKERWERDMYSRITTIKDSVIDFFLKSDFDYLFFTDSDLVLHPQTIEALLKQNKDFCAEIFWTKFSYVPTYAPNCWNQDGYTVDDLKLFREKGTYNVGFTGACTLLSRKILEDNVRFKKIDNLNWLGEDKHFCIRASVLGYDIFINTEFPAFHIYEEYLLPEARKFVSDSYSLGYLDAWLDTTWEQKISSWLNVVKKKPGLVTRLKKVIRKL